MSETVQKNRNVSIWKWQVIKVHHYTKEDGAKDQGKMVESTWTNLQSQHWLQSRDSNMQTYSGNVRINQMTIISTSCNLLNFSTTGQYLALCHHQKHVQKKKKELTVSILVSCSAMRAAGNPRILVGSNLEASGGGLVKPVWSAKGEAVQ